MKLHAKMFRDHSYSIGFHSCKIRGFLTPALRKKSNYLTLFTILLKYPPVITSLIKNIIKIQYKTVSFIRAHDNDVL